MSFMFIDKNERKINLPKNSGKALELFGLSIGYNIIKSKYPYKSNITQSSIFILKWQKKKQKLMINYRKSSIKKNIAKMIYKANKSSEEIKILDIIFISTNMKRAKIIINNKQYDLKENIKSIINKIYKIKIKFFDIIVKLNFMFKDSESLSSVHNLQNLNTKYLKSLSGLFHGCSSLLYIDNISNNEYINSINYLFLIKIKFFKIRVI